VPEILPAWLTEADVDFYTVGFTNRTVWAEYGPIWGYVYNRTVHNLAEIGDTFSLTGLAEARSSITVALRMCWNHNLELAIGMSRSGQEPRKGLAELERYHLHGT
jgi:hypothetical protein